jgi:hypothetical protein
MSALRSNRGERFDQHHSSKVDPGRAFRQCSRSTEARFFTEDAGINFQACAGVLGSPRSAPRSGFAAGGWRRNGTHLAEATHLLKKESKTPGTCGKKDTPCRPQLGIGI